MQGNNDDNYNDDNYNHDDNYNDYRIQHHAAICGACTSTMDSAGDNDKHNIAGDNDKHNIAGDNDKHCIGGDNDKHCITVLQSCGPRACTLEYSDAYTRDDYSDAYTSGDYTSVNYTSADYTSADYTSADYTSADYSDTYTSADYTSTDGSRTQQHSRISGDGTCACWRRCTHWWLASCWGTRTRTSRANGATCSHHGQLRTPCWHHANNLDHSTSTQHNATGYMDCTTTLARPNNASAHVRASTSALQPARSHRMGTCAFSSAWSWRASNRTASDRGAGRDSSGAASDHGATSDTRAASRASASCWTQNRACQSGRNNIHN